LSFTAFHGFFAIVPILKAARKLGRFSNKSYAKTPCYSYLSTVEKRLSNQSITDQSAKADLKPFLTI
jgi:hypothetical protein